MEESPSWSQDGNVSPPQCSGVLRGKPTRMQSPTPGQGHQLLHSGARPETSWLTLQKPPRAEMLRPICFAVCPATTQSACNSGRTAGGRPSQGCGRIRASGRTRSQVLTRQGTGCTPVSLGSHSLKKGQIQSSPLNVLLK